MNIETKENAFLFIASIRAALKNGVKHYATTSGELLETEIGILQELIANKKVLLDTSERKEITTDLEELKLIETQYRNRI